LPPEIKISGFQSRRISSVHLLGLAGPLKWEVKGNFLRISIPASMRAKKVASYAAVFKVSCPTKD